MKARSVTPSSPRKLKRRKVKVPVKKRNILILSLSLITLFLLIFFVAGPLDISTGGFIRWIAGALWIVMIINLILLIIGIRDFPDSSYHTLFRVLAIVAPAVSLGAYVIVYLIGILK